MLSRDERFKQHKANHDHYKECCEAVSWVLKPPQLSPWAIQHLWLCKTLDTLQIS